MRYETNLNNWRIVKQHETLNSSPHLFWVIDYETQKPIPFFRDEYWSAEYYLGRTKLYLKIRNEIKSIIINEPLEQIKEMLFP